MSSRWPSIVAAVVGLALAGATLFGLWHVVVGGLVKGNVRAGEFGVVLAIVAGALLAVEIAAVRRLGLVRRGRGA